MNNFEQFLNEFLEFTNPEVLKHRFDEYANFQKDFLDAEMNTEGYKSIHLKFQDSENGEFVETIINYDKHLHSQAANYFNHPSTRITNEISDIAQLNKYLNMLRTGVTQIKDHQEFYDNYRLYVTAIIKLGETLKEIQEVFDKPLNPVKNNTNQLGEKTAKAVELKSYLNIIKNAGDHDEAIKKIKELHPEFEYPITNLHLFTDDDKLVEIRACRTLEEIGRIKWGKDGPGHGLIKKTLSNLFK